MAPYLWSLTWAILAALVCGVCMLLASIQRGELYEVVVVGPGLVIVEAAAEARFLYLTSQRARLFPRLNKVAPDILKIDALNAVVVALALVALLSVVAWFVCMYTGVESPWAVTAFALISCEKFAEWSFKFWQKLQPFSLQNRLLNITRWRGRGHLPRWQHGLLFSIEEGSHMAEEAFETHSQRAVDWLVQHWPVLVGIMAMLALQCAPCHAWRQSYVSLNVAPTFLVGPVMLWATMLLLTL